MDWYDEEMSEWDYEQLMAQKEMQNLQRMYTTDGQRQGQIDMTDEQEEILQDQGFQEGYSRAKQQYCILAQVELIICNSELFPAALVEQCRQFHANEQMDFGGMELILKEL